MRFRRLNTIRRGFLLALSLGSVANAAIPKSAELFGVILGAKPSVPDCGGLVFPSKMCWKHGVAPLRDILGIKPGEARDIQILFGEKTPEFVQGLGFGATMIDGKIESVRILTTGLRVQFMVLAQLETKFGKPSGSRVERAQNGFGAVFEILHASWVLGGTTVTFVGRTSEGDYGAIVAETAKYRAINAAESAKANQGVPRL